MKGLYQKSLVKIQQISKDIEENVTFTDIEILNYLGIMQSRGVICI